MTSGEQGRAQLVARYPQLYGPQARVSTQRKWTTETILNEPGVKDLATLDAQAGNKSAQQALADLARGTAR
jgi:hypothetical protein